MKEQISFNIRLLCKKLRDMKLRAKIRIFLFTITIFTVTGIGLYSYGIAKEELKGLKRAEYGEKIIKELSKNLTEKYGKGFDRGNLYHFLDFYKTFPQIVYSLSEQSKVILS